MVLMLVAFTPLFLFPFLYDCFFVLMRCGGWVQTVWCSLHWCLIVKRQYIHGRAKRHFCHMQGSYRGFWKLFSNPGLKTWHNWYIWVNTRQPCQPKHLKPEVFLVQHDGFCFCNCCGFRRWQWPSLKGLLGLVFRLLLSGPSSHLVS